MVSCWFWNFVFRIYPADNIMKDIISSIMYMAIYQPPSLHTLLSITYAITVVEWTVKNWEVPWMILCSMFVRGAQMCLKSR